MYRYVQCSGDKSKKQFNNACKICSKIGWSFTLNSAKSFTMAKVILVFIAQYSCFFLLCGVWIQSCCFLVLWRIVCTTQGPMVNDRLIPDTIWRDITANVTQVNDWSCRKHGSYTGSCVYWLVVYLDRSLHISLTRHLSYQPETDKGK